MKMMPQRGSRTATNAKNKTKAKPAVAGSKPDFMDVNKNGNRKESMKAAMKSKGKNK